jgi:hypothetical protein
MAANLTNNRMFERHFTVQTLAEVWALSQDTVQSWFEDEQGVVKLGNMGGRGKRRKVSLRIPESIAERVYLERTQ